MTNVLHGIKYLVLVCVLLFASAPCFAEASSAPDNFIALKGGSHGPLGSWGPKWDCKGPATATLKSGDGTNPAPGVPEGASFFSLEVPIAELSCNGGSVMEEHMRKTLKYDNYPLVQYKMIGYVVSGKEVTIKGYLTIGGVTQPTEIVGTLTPLGASGARVRGEAKVNMKEGFNIQPPSLMMITVDELVTVAFDIVVP